MALAPKTNPTKLKRTLFSRSIRKMAIAQSNEANPAVTNTNELLHTFLLTGNHQANMQPISVAAAP